MSGSQAKGGTQQQEMEESIKNRETEEEGKKERERERKWDERVPPRGVEEEE